MEGEQDRRALEERLEAIGDELLATTLGPRERFNYEIDAQRERLHAEADEIRRQLGIPALDADKAYRSSSHPSWGGWTTLIGAIVAIVGLLWASSTLLP